MIRYGNSRSIPELKKLWKECFADEDAYIDAFFKAMYEDEYVLLEEENGVLRGASFFLPAKIWLAQPRLRGGWQQLRYVYALAVYPKYRGRGIAGRLLCSAKEIYGAPLVAEPAEEGLVGGFYRPLGFTENFYIRKQEIELPEYGLQAAQLSSVSDSFPIRAEEYCGVRDQWFQKHGYISWPARHVAFAVQVHCANGGGAYTVCRGGRKDLILYFQEGRTAVVTETTLPQKAAKEWLMARVAGQCSRVVLTSEAAGYQPGRDTTDGSFCLTGMSLDLPKVHGYLNLSLD